MVDSIDRNGGGKEIIEVNSKISGMRFFIPKAKLAIKTILIFFILITCLATIAKSIFLVFRLFNNFDYSKCDKMHMSLETRYCQLQVFIITAF